MILTEYSTSKSMKFCQLVKLMIFFLYSVSILRPTLLSEAVTPNALDESIPIVKLKPPLFGTVVTLAPYHISGFIVTKPLEFSSAAMLEAFTLAGLAHDAE